MVSLVKNDLVLLQGCLTIIYRGTSYDDVKSNSPICESYVSVMRAMDHHVLLTLPPGESGSASTDMGTSRPLHTTRYDIPFF